MHVTFTVQVYTTCPIVILNEKQVCTECIMFAEMICYRNKTVVPSFVGYSLLEVSMLRTILKVLRLR
jgi:hypothetical protein